MNIDRAKTMQIDDFRGYFLAERDHYQQIAAARGHPLLHLGIIDICSFDAGEMPNRTPLSDIGRFGNSMTSGQTRRLGKDPR